MERRSGKRRYLEIEMIKEEQKEEFEITITKEELEALKRRRKKKLAKEEEKRQRAYYIKCREEIQEREKKFLDELKDHAAPTPFDKVIKDTIISTDEKSHIPKFKGENPVRAREGILQLCDKLFFLLTGEKLTDNLEVDEIVATSRSAVENMRLLTTYQLGLRELAAIQYAIIPTVKALEECRDVFYDAVENEKENEERGGR